MRIVFLAAALFAAMAGLSGAEAAECAEGGMPRDEVICADPSLAAYDTEMQGLYAAALQALPEADAAMLKNHQDQWLDYLDKVCPAGTDDIADCFVGQYISRNRALKAAALKSGPFLFGRVDIYEAEPVKGGGSPPAQERHAAYPRIVDPQTDAERAWNELNVQRPERGKCKGPGDSDIDYEIHLATPELISVLWTKGYYCHGAPHPFAVTSGVTMKLSPAPHPITAEDIFLPATDWRGRLDRAVRDGVAKAALEKGETVDPARLDGYAEKTENWILSQDGLVIIFDPHYLGTAGFAPSILVEWSTLADVLQPGLGLPPT